MDKNKTKTRRPLNGGATSDCGEGERGSKCTVSCMKPAIGAVDYICGDDGLWAASEITSNCAQFSCFFLLESPTPARLRDRLLRGALLRSAIVPSGFGTE